MRNWPICAARQLSPVSGRSIVQPAHIEAFIQNHRPVRYTLNKCTLGLFAANFGQTIGTRHRMAETPYCASVYGEELGFGYQRWNCMDLVFL